MDDNYSSVETQELIGKALGKVKALPITYVESRLFEVLYESLVKYMPRTDVVQLLADLRHKFLAGFTATTAVNLHKVCQKCRLCTNTEGTSVDPLWNLSDPDMMIVVENPTVFKAAGEFLKTSLAGVGFKLDRCALTYSTRCPIGFNELSSDNIVNCTPYLHTEINVLQPKLVLLLGSKVWSAVSGDVVHKISEVENNLCWLGPYCLLPGMSLLWYDRAAEQSKNRGSGRFIDLLTTAWNFLYATSQEPVAYG